MNYNEEIQLDKLDQKLERFFSNNVAITNEEDLLHLHSRYKGHEGVVTAFRGMLFSNKEQLEAFMSNLEINGGYISGIASSLSLSEGVARAFSVTRPTYDDVDAYRESAAGLRNGEWVSGYEGVLLELEVNGSDCIDMSNAGFNAESELLLMPHRAAKVKSVKHQIPYHRQFSEGLASIDDFICENGDLSDPRVNYILNNLIETLTPNQFELLFDMAQRRNEERTKDSRIRIHNGESEIFDKAKELGTVLCHTWQTNRGGEDVDNSVFIHPNGISVRESTLSRYENRQYIDYIVVTTDSMISSIQCDLVDMLSGLDPDIFGETYQKLRTKLSDQCNAICAAILDASELPEFKGQEIHDQLVDDLRKYASPLNLTALKEAMHPDCGSEMIKLNNQAHLVSNKRQLDEHTAKVAVEMEKMLTAIHLGKPSRPTF